MVTLQALALTLSLTGAGQTVLLDFYSDQCPPCRQMMPVIAQFEAKGYPVRKINVTHQPQLAQQYNVQSWPMFLMLAEGREVGRLVGYQPANQILALYQRAGVTPEAYARQGAPDASRGLGDRRQTPRRGSQEAEDRTQLADGRDMPNANRAAPSGVERYENDEEVLRDHLTIQQRAMTASVRIKIHDGQGQSYGSGTIVDSQNGEALVLTCGHIFRDAKGGGKITIDLFDKDGAPVGSVPGQVIHFDMQRDVGLIAIRPNREVTPMKIAGRNLRMQRGDRVFSIGCDRGDPPSVRESRVSHMNKYLGPANIEVAGAPIDGRSGGGLFASDGTIIGVCNAADPEDDEGLYAAIETIHEELIAAKLNFLLDDNQALSAVSAPQTPLNEAVLPRGMAVPSSMRNDNQDRQPLVGGDTEIIVIMRSRSRPQEQGEVIFVRDPSTSLLDAIADHQQRRTGGASTVQQAAATSPTPTPIFRGQN